MASGPDISKEVLEAILALIDEGIHVVDMDGTTIFYNEVAARHDGLTVNEVIGKPLLNVFPSLDKETSTLLKVMETRKAIYNEAQHYTNVHGRKIETINTTLPIIVDEVLVGAMEIAKDYSTMKRLSEQLLDLQKKISSKKGLRKKNTRSLYTFNDLLTVNQALLQIKAEAMKLAASYSPILVVGESGTGKELFVQGIHSASNRAQNAFIAQNCAAIPETLLESILFGTAKGSFTGAVERPGLFELAHGGTLFLDELHAMPIDIQAKLLRVLEDGIVRRVGGTNDTFVDVRIVAAMNVPPQEALDKRKIRADLFYRLNVLSFELSPLRERQEDISYLTDVFIARFNKMMNKHIKSVTQEVRMIFTAYPWPGNVRELKNTIEYMMNVCEGEQLTVAELPIMLRGYNHSQMKDAENQREQELPFRAKVDQYERKLIKAALLTTDGNIKQAAKLLQIPRQTLQYKLQKYHLLDAE